MIIGSPHKPPSYLWVQKKLSKSRLCMQMPSFLRYFSLPLLFELDFLTHPSLAYFLSYFFYSLSIHPQISWGKFVSDVPWPHIHTIIDLWPFFKKKKEFFLLYYPNLLLFHIDLAIFVSFLLEIFDPCFFSVKNTFVVFKDFSFFLSAFLRHNFCV